MQKAKNTKRKRRRNNTKMFSYLSQCNLDKYNVTVDPVDPGPDPDPDPEPDPDPDPEPGIAWDVAGMWTKIEGYQQNNANFFPSNYRTTPNAAGNVDSVFGQLDRFLWYKGIQYPVAWGAIDNGNANPNLWNWTELDMVTNMIRDLFLISGRQSAKNKKIIFLLSYKTFSPEAIDDILPNYLQTTGGALPATYTGGATRFNRAMGWQAGAAGRVTDGYTLKLQDFRDGLTGTDANGNPIYTLRDKHYAFVTALYNRYKDNPAFGGICTTEPTPNDASKYYLPSEYPKSAYFAGRMRMLKFYKTIMTKHLLAEAIELHNDPLLDPPRLDIQTLINNRLAFINPNYHVGANLESIYEAADQLDGIVAILNSCQGLDMDSKTGFVKRGGANPNDVYNFLPNPPNYGQPRTQIENPNLSASGAVLTFDPPDYIWIVRRAIYLKTNLLMYQHNYATVGNKSAPRYNWKDFYTAINNNTTLISPNTGGLIQNDPACGMITTRPSFVA